MSAPLAIPPIDPTAQWALTIFAILIVLWLIIRPWAKRKDPLAQQPFKTSLAQQRALERQMSNLVVELSEMARQITAQLDTRAAKLEMLIKEADEKIGRLGTNGSGETQSLMAAHGGGNGAGAVERVPPEPPAEPDPRHAQVYALADQGRSSQQIAQELHRPSGEIELILALRARG
jgi:hypothetical protein